MFETVWNIISSGWFWALVLLLVTIYQSDKINNLTYHKDFCEQELEDMQELHESLQDDAEELQFENERLTHVLCNYNYYFNHIPKELRKNAVILDVIVEEGYTTLVYVSDKDTSITGVTHMVEIEELEDDHCAGCPHQCI